jgi:hypothetical protein
MDAMRISRGLFVLAIVGAAALGYAADQLRSSYPRFPFSRSVPSNPGLPSGQLYYVVMPNVEALIDHKKVSANPTKAEWQSTGSLLPITKEQCEAQLKERSEWQVGIAGSDADAPQRNVQIDVTNLRRCVPADAWDSVEKYSPDPKDVFRP